jgi:hypothetical protein
MPRLLMVSTAVMINFLAAQFVSADENPLLTELLTRGVRVTAETSVLLPKPTLCDGLSAAQQRQLLAAMPDNRQTWENLTRRSVVAPFVLKISQSEPGAGPVGSRVDLWFVAHGRLERLDSDDFLQEQFQTARDNSDEENRPKIQLLSDDLLRQRGLKIPRTPADPRYLSVELSLMERVRISGTSRNIKSTTRDSVTVASMLDARFDQDPEFSNSWRSIERDASGRRQYGARHTYNSMGSYVKATRLAEPAGALLIEYHVAFAEPEGWFHGANLLRSKLPIAVQEGVRRFRRNFEKPQENAATTERIRK